ncbi:MAG: hypothetical protein Q9160_008992 [Pyrenula sp. 1 TL-2023]
MPSPKASKQNAEKQKPRQDEPKDRKSVQSSADRAHQFAETSATTTNEQRSQPHRRSGLLHGTGAWTDKAANPEPFVALNSSPPRPCRDHANLLHNSAQSSGVYSGLPQLERLLIECPSSQVRQINEDALSTFMNCPFCVETREKIRFEGQS